MTKRLFTAIFLVGLFFGGGYFFPQLFLYDNLTIAESQRACAKSEVDIYIDNPIMEGIRGLGKTIVTDDTDRGTIVSVRTLWTIELARYRVVCGRTLEALRGL